MFQVFNVQQYSGCGAVVFAALVKITSYKLQSYNYKSCRVCIFFNIIICRKSFIVKKQVFNLLRECELSIVTCLTLSPSHAGED